MNKFIIAVVHVLLAYECPEGMIYKQCGPACPQTCDTDRYDDCIDGCIEGCFCPDGQVVSNGYCIYPSECQGLYVTVCKVMHLLYLHQKLLAI